MKNEKKTICFFFVFNIIAIYKAIFPHEPQQCHPAQNKFIALSFSLLAHLPLGMYAFPKRCERLDWESTLLYSDLKGVLQTTKVEILSNHLLYRPLPSKHFTATHLFFLLPSMDLCVLCVPHIYGLHHWFIHSGYCLKNNAEIFIFREINFTKIFVNLISQKNYTS